MSLWTYYRSLTPRTRAIAGASVVLYAIAGLYVSDTAERVFGLTPSEKDRKQLEGLVPKVRSVERE